MFKHILGIVALVVAAESGARAEWHEAKSKHFIIYADQDANSLRDFAIRLEKFDAAVRHARKMTDPPVGDGNRLQVFVTRSEAAVRKLANDRSGFIRGFYVPRATGSVAFVPRTSGTGSEWDLDAETVFFHEYAHHLMMQELESPYPEWLIEGFAEFMATARFEKDGSVGLGAAPKHRAYGLFMLDSLPLETMLTGAYDRINDEQRESIYGRGWLLAHYLTFEPGRSGQLQSYLNGIGKGVGPLQAARSAFGDLKQLDRDLRGYLQRRRLSYLKISPQALPAPAVEVKRLSPAAAAVMPIRMESKRGVNEKTAGGVAARARKIVSEHPADPLAEVTLAEAEFDVNRYDAAEAAADRALKLDPRNTEAMIYKGRAILERAAASKGHASSQFAAARKWFSSANKIDPEDPEPLMLFHESYAREGVAPPANAVAALHYASNLAPQDAGLRLRSVMQYLHDRKLSQARRTLAPIAYNPHGGEIRDAARAIIARIDAGDAEGAAKLAEGR